MAEESEALWTPFDLVVVHRGIIRNCIRHPESKPMYDKMMKGKELRYICLDFPVVYYTARLPSLGSYTEQDNLCYLNNKNAY